MDPRLVDVYRTLPPLKFVIVTVVTICVTFFTGCLCGTPWLTESLFFVSRHWINMISMKSAFPLPNGCSLHSLTYSRHILRLLNSTGSTTFVNPSRADPFMYSALGIGDGKALYVHCVDRPVVFFSIGSLASMDLKEGRRMGNTSSFIRGVRLHAMAYEWNRAASFFVTIFRKSPCASLSLHCALCCAEYYSVTFPYYNGTVEYTTRPGQGELSQVM